MGLGAGSVYEARNWKLIMVTKEEKARRMELNRKLGFRKTNSFFFDPSTGGGKHRSTHVCFECRDAKRFPSEIIQRNCTTCGNAMKRMGWSFKAPKRSSLSQWKKVKRLYEAGERFSSSGREHALPDKLSEVDVYLEEMAERLTTPK